ncbi:hypothetical protein DFJ74DRAFT_204108 [Hyaloraphidium curvatum]|nr:hypothetical protein DFJ74DRAFT_204108 [Hyaloraphidium curvatum]
MDDPSDFPAQLECLRELDNAMRCPICKELYSDYPPLTLVSCLHSGCSYCVRKAVQESSICPICRDPADETKIRVNRDLERVVTAWRTRSRDAVLELARSAAQPRPGPVPEGQVIAAAPSATSVPPQAAQAAEDSVVDDGVVVIDDPPAQEVVKCPICNNDVRMQYMNKHLDKNCTPDPFLARKGSGSDVTAFFAPQSSARDNKGAPKKVVSAKPGFAQGASGDERTRIPPLVFDILNDKKLREHCKKHGLAEVGTRGTLIRRLSEFILRYNANLDSEVPKPTRRIVDEVVRWERQIENSRPSSVTQLGKDKIDPAKFDGKAYLRANSQLFAQLTETARRSKGGPSRPAEVGTDDVIDLDPESPATESGDAGRSSEEENRSDRVGFFAQRTVAPEAPDDGPPAKRQKST